MNFTNTFPPRPKTRPTRLASGGRTGKKKMKKKKKKKKKKKDAQGCESMA